ncbi:ATP-dependent Clp protease proteolytic subunit [Saccharicrinis fermentans DSM 9555 = JCM 21142]|uniref:ATP-dependent Clp protease proteolytic subunit n=1 Tax=Saccharicrinis fermentans DSM 9555 = JCM 21142 TaxID=869213 RepID=W7XWY2_9BACT|nr:ATP-dependent Clp protease proteolytic subunit [Saccharicrinis fermentans DSM 9555 = JCM 21142]
MIDPKDFQKYATKHIGINSLALDKYTSVSSGYISPTIIEERQLNVASMDVFSRLMMDRIIFMGLPVDDTVANIIQAQLLYLESADPQKDISIYFNSPGGSVYAGLGIYDTMQYISSDVATICTGMAASMAAVLLTAGTKGKRSALTHSRVMIHQHGWRTRTSFRYRNNSQRDSKTQKRIIHHYCRSFRKYLQKGRERLRS